MTNYTRITTIGGLTISALTILSALYLLYSLVSHGRGKLRVRLLIGIVISDMSVGLVALPAQALLLSGGKMGTGTAGCNAQGFLFTTALFSQHLWTLCIAIATFMLLKYPLHPATTHLERWAWLAWPVVWGVSALHAGIWMATVGFVQSGSQCYYGTKSAVPGLDRDLVQFVPRAFVFVAICGLYTRLFSFLRRPDTIQLSSTGGSLHATSVGAGAQPARNKPPRAKTPLVSCLRDPSAPLPNPAAPWEAMEFIHVGGEQSWLKDDDGEVEDQTAPDRKLSGNTTLVDAAERRFSFVGEKIKGLSGFADRDRGAGGRKRSVMSLGYGFGAESIREDEGTGEGDDGTTAVNSASNSAKLTPSRPFFAPEYDVVAAPSPTRAWFSSDTASAPAQLSRIASLPFSLGSQTQTRGSVPADFKDDLLDDDNDSGPSLVEFFQANQLASGVRAPKDSADASASAPQQMSATAYFNRQASLLMLYFPLAYMLVFSISLARLIYDMVHHRTNPVLSLLSNWMTMAVGLIDALTYGLAEYLVRRRVRRKMPDRLG
ncbi:uncharacterized protein LOC62_02G003041 [Vanrija pseudolonga]|uniref:Glucose receptor Git3-like N-terminal domain-containing protein n=1 Tax=Vanrija pseudolonga TaxID=143232 RepID=A0AAF0Y799_9TREE|nr:hypothetical protein LOC62_02G003041 [Vanrija pseudolonga]